jgi:hypothetical protein
MRPTQEFWLADMSRAARTALDVLARFRDENKASAEFIGSILGKIRAGGRGTLVAVGCSPAVQQDLIVRDILKAVPEIAATLPDDHAPEQLLIFPAPPLVDSPFGQLRVLHDRYRTEAGVLDIRYKHEPRYPDGVGVQRSTETEALVAMLRARRTKAVFITSAQNLIDMDGAVAAVDRLFRHLADIARRADVPHIVLGDRGSILRVAGGARSADQMRFVLQRLYDYSVTADVGAFASILKSYQITLGACSDIVLAERTARIMERVGGDPCRFSEWLCSGLSEAANNAQKLNWKHLNKTGPRLTQINEANRDLSHYLAWEKFESLDSPLIPEPDKPRNKRSTKPGERLPERDPVPPGGMSNAA